MAATITGRIEVSTCIACGARTRLGECPGGCTEVPLDIVEAAPVDALAERFAALEHRVEGLRAVAVAFAEPGTDWDAARAEGHAALQEDVPAPVEPPVVVEAWGCPECGRVDAPQPCLDVCIRHPVTMVDASAWKDLATAAAELEVQEQRLSQVVNLIVHVRPRAGQEQRSRLELAERARAASAATVAEGP